MRENGKSEMGKVEEDAEESGRKGKLEDIKVNDESKKREKDKRKKKEYHVGFKKERKRDKSRLRVWAKVKWAGPSLVPQLLVPRPGGLGKVVIPKVLSCHAEGLKSF